MSKTLYEIIGVPKNATTIEIAKAYRTQSLKCHPDRNPEGAEHFKRLTAAYEVLKDEEKRALYDTTGLVEGEEGEAAASPQLRHEDMAQMMEEFYSTYRGSAEEIADICESYQKVKGDFSRLVTEELLYRNEKAEISRLRDIVKGLVDAGSLPKTAAWERTGSDENLKKLGRRMKREREEASEALRELSGKVGGPKTEASSMGDLQALILGRQQAERNAFHSTLDDMAKRYGGADRKEAKKVTAKPKSK